MVEIVYYRRYHRVTVKGHAGTAPAGEDLVCAAVSALCCTLAENVAQLHRLRKVTEPEIRLENGDAEISCVPVDGYQSGIRIIFEAVCIGFALLSGKYPGAVSYSIHR
nr:MAG TPA: YsxB-like protein [Caudoviricetes sp.]